MKDRKETWPGDSVLGRRIWRRYAAAPGLISTAGTLQRVGRLMGVGKLPLLASVQRRWMPQSEIWPHGGSSLHYVRSASAEPSFSTPDVGVTAPSVGNAGRVVQRGTLPSASLSGEMVGESRTAPPQMRGLGQPGSDESTTTLAVDSSGLGAAIVQRYQETSIGQAAQVQVASPEAMSLSDPAEPSSAQVQRGGGGSRAPLVANRDRPLYRRNPRHLLVKANWVRRPCNAIREPR